MMPLNRRSLLMHATALVGAASLSRAAATGPLQLGRMAEIDTTLQASVEAGTVPGIVAMAATERAILYQGCFGLRDIKGEGRMSLDTIFNRNYSSVATGRSAPGRDLTRHAGGEERAVPERNFNPKKFWRQALAGLDDRRTS
jgi:hypothetical protein